jgi:rhodanese-related sulfurtransferase
MAGEVSDDTYLIDVREPEEWAAGHAPGAHHIPMMQIPGRLDEVPDDREVVVICRVGERSARVVDYLRANGFDNVHNLDGGLRDWVAAGRPVVNDEGSTAWVA